MIQSRKNNSMADSEAMAKQWGCANSECPKVMNQIVHPDTFVQIESHCFKDLVQKLTGAAEDSGVKKLPVTRHARSSKKDGFRSVWDCSPLVKCGFKVGIKKPAFKLQHRRKFQKKLEINLGLNDHHIDLRLNDEHFNLGLNDHNLNLGMNGHCYGERVGVNSYGIRCATLPPLICSPITPLGPFDPFNSPPSYYYYDSTPTSGNQSPHSEEEEQKFSFEGSAMSVKRQPELLPLFPLHSSTESTP